MIKYLGSKRALVGVLGDIATAVQARDAVDLFTGTTRVAQEFKRRGLHVTAVDYATYSEVLAQCYIATDARLVNHQRLEGLVAELDALPGRRGYFTRTFCEESRFFQPHNGQRVDAIRDHLRDHLAADPLLPVLLTSLMIAADRVDSTTGVQMAYLKEWAPRASRRMRLQVPELLPGSGTAMRVTIPDELATVPAADLAYLDPPYNQHRYYTNYHVWETLVRWDEPEAYGIARKRVDSRDEKTKSVFNRKRLMPTALAETVAGVRADVVVVSYNDESWVEPEQIMGWLREGHEDVRLLAFDSRRYVGAQIGIHNRSGERVGKVSHLRNTEYVFIAGSTERVEAAMAVGSAPGRSATAGVAGLKDPDAVH